MRKLILTAMTAVALAAGVPKAEAAGGGVALPDRDWSWEGVFGNFDRDQLRRGFLVYQNICSSCHGLDLLYYRNLTQLGYTDEEVKAIAAQKEVEDGPNDEGEMFYRPAKPSDNFVDPFPNEEMARLVNGGSLPPDLTLMAEARAGGADYIYALMTGYKDVPPEGADVPAGKYYNEYFPGHAIGMPPQLYPGMVSYPDGTEATPEQMAADVAGFLRWTAEPNLEQRKSLGVKVMIYLAILTALFYALKRRIWARVH